MGLLKITPLEERIVLDAAIGHDVGQAAAASAAGADAAASHILVIPVNSSDPEQIAQASRDNVVVALYETPNHEKPCSEESQNNSSSDSKTTNPMPLISTAVVTSVIIDTNDCEPQPQANLVVDKSFTNLTSHPDSTVHAGDILSYSITVTNIGNEVAFTPTLTDILPSNTTYIPGTLTITQGSETGPQTDAANDDLGQISGNMITFFLGETATANESGFLEAGSSTTVTFQVRVNADSANNIEISNSATVTYFKGETDILSQAVGTVTFGVVNDAPIANNDSYTLNEDNSLQVDPPSYLANDTDTEGQLSSFAILDSTTNGNLVINDDGSFTYTPNANFFGTDSFTYQVFDSANQASNIATVTLQVTSINDAPGFVVGANQTVDQGTGENIVNGFVTNITLGPSNESNQTIQFQVTTNNPGLFSQQPLIDTSGNLSYTLNPNASGTALITVFAQDSGGTANGGVDTAGPQSFILTVNPITKSAPSSIPTEGGVAPGSPPPISAGGITVSTTVNPQPIPVENPPPTPEITTAPLIQYEVTHFTDRPNASTPIAVTRPEITNLTLTLQPYTLDRSEPVPFTPEITESSAPILIDAAPRTTAAILAAAAITDISYPGLNRRAEFAIPVRFSMSSIVIIPESDPITRANGGNVKLRVSLSSLPTTRVVVSFKSSNPDLAAVTPSELVFSPTNWNMEQFVTVIGKGGSIAGDDYQILVLPAQSSDPNYNELETDPVNMRAVA